MRKISTILVLALLALTTVSCDGMLKDKSEETEKPEKVFFKRININDLYSVELPSYMNEAYDLNDVASLQYQSEDETKYIIVIDEALEDYDDFFEAFVDYDPERDFLEQYAELQMEDLYTNAEILEEGDYIKTEIGGHPAVTKLVQTQQEDIPAPMTIQLAFIEGENHVYMVMIWAPRIMDDVWEDDRTKIMESFKEMS